MDTTTQLKTKIFADGADKAGMLEMYQNPLIQGFTTNPTLMRKAGITDYKAKEYYSARWRHYDLCSCKSFGHAPDCYYKQYSCSSITGWKKGYGSRNDRRKNITGFDGDGGGVCYPIIETATC